MITLALDFKQRNLYWCPRKKRLTIEGWLTMPGKFSSAQRWSEKDILDLERGLAHGRTLKEIANTLGRDINDVREAAAALGNGVPLARVCGRPDPLFRRLTATAPRDRCSIGRP